MNHRRLFLAAATAPALLPSLAGCAAPPPAAADRDAAIATLRAAELAFARTMADRDATAFATFIAEDAVFLNGGRPLRGRAAITGHWARFFAEPAAPFSWAPETAEVAAGGRLGYTEGPVRDAGGTVIATFFTTWQRDAAGRWQAVFDNGYSACKA